MAMSISGSSSASSVRGGCCKVGGSGAEVGLELGEAIVGMGVEGDVSERLVEGIQGFDS